MVPILSKEVCWNPGLHSTVLSQVPVSCMAVGGHMHRHQRPKGHRYASARAVLEEAGSCLGPAGAPSGVTVLVRNCALLEDQDRGRAKF